MANTTKATIILAADGVTKVVQVETITPAVSQSSTFTVQTKDQLTARNAVLANTKKSTQAQSDAIQAKADAINAEIKANEDLIAQL